MIRQNAYFLTSWGASGIPESLLTRLDLFLFWDEVNSGLLLCLLAALLLFLALLVPSKNWVSWNLACEPFAWGLTLGYPVTVGVESAGGDSGWKRGLGQGQRINNVFSASGDLRGNERCNQLSSGEMGAIDGTFLKISWF